MKNLHTSHIKTSLFLLLNILTLSSLHAQQFNYHITEVIKPSEISSDSTLDLYKTQLQTSITKSDTPVIIESLIQLSTLERINLDYSSAVNHAGEALFIADDYGDSLLLSRAHEEVGVLNYLFKQDQQAFFHFSNAHMLYKGLRNQNKIDDAGLYRSYYNMLLYYQRISDDVNTKAYVDSCRNIAIKAKMNPLYKVFLWEKEANSLFKNNKFNETIAQLKQSANILEKFDSKSDSGIINKGFLIIIYSRIAESYINLDDLESAETYYEKSINQPDYYGEHTFFLSYVLARYATLLNKLGKNNEAYQKLLKAKLINDTYLNPRNDNTQSFLSLKDRYGEALRKKNDELNAKNLELATNKQSILRFRIFIIILLMVIFILVFLFITRWQHLKHKKENEINEQKQAQAKELLEHRNRELTSSMLQLIEKEEIIKTLKSNLEKSPANKALISTIEKQSGNLWEAFNSRFIELNEDFYTRLNEKVPGLSAADLKICALIKLNFSGKEMAYLLGISEGSINVARHRLRKKMNIERDTNLVQYINEV